MTDSTLLLIHGLGATSGVWADAAAAIDWPGRVVSPDLPGHGSAPAGVDYTLPVLAEAVAELCAQGEPVVMVGHSLGGAVALELASGRYRPSPVAVVGIGIKCTWTDNDVAGMAKVAARGVRWFDTEQEATDRFLKQSGLVGLVQRDHPALGDAVRSERNAEGVHRWRVSQDPATFAQQPVDMAALLAAARCPVILGAGEHDAMATRAELEAFISSPQTALGRGHNVHVEDPAWVAALVGSITPQTDVG